MITYMHCSEPGARGRANEDWIGIFPGIPMSPVVVLDGGTARTDTGCIHDVAWFSRHLGKGLLWQLDKNHHHPLTRIIYDAIFNLSVTHARSCDLSHPATPSAAVGIARPIQETVWEYAVLGDVTIAIEASGELTVTTDSRISASAEVERREVDRWPIGSPGKTAALTVMKHAELAQRNKSYWVAAADPEAANHALTGIARDVTSFAVMTDGAARAHSFGVSTWAEVFQVAREAGPGGLIHQVRALESSDPKGERWPRNKASDDASAVFVEVRTEQ